MRGIRPLVIVCGLLAALWAGGPGAGPAAGQWTTGSLVGRIVDGESAPLGNARVFLVPTQPARDGRPLSVTSDDRGHFVLLGLDPGIYALRADREGFRSVENRSVTVLVGQPTVIQLQLARLPPPVRASAARPTVVQAGAPRSSTQCTGQQN